MAKTFDLSVIFKLSDRMTAPLKRVGKAMSKLTIPVKQIKQSVRALARDKSLKGFGIQMQLVRKSFRIAAEKIKKDLRGITKELRAMAKTAGTKMKDIGQNLSLKLTAPLALAGGLATKFAIDFESAFTGVRKTVNATEEEFGILRKQLMGMALELPLATEELFGIAEAAGQLGIQKKDIIAFTKVMADLGATTNLTADEAATNLARFANITAMSQKDFDRLGSTIVDLGNNMATTEAEIVAIGMRLAGAGKVIGLSQHQIMGLAAGLSSVGIQAEAGGTAFSQVMKKIDKEIGTGSDEMKSFAAISGKTVKEFEKSWKEDAGSSLVDFIEGLAEVQKSGANVNIILDELGMEGIRISDSLLRAAGAGDLMREALDRGAKAWKENSALAKEAALRYKTSAAQLTMAKNRAIQMAVFFGAVLVPALLKVIKFLEPVVDWLTKLSPITKIVIVTIGALAAAIGPLLLGLGMLSIAIGAITAPIAITVAAVMGLGVAAGLLIAYWMPIKDFFSDLWGFVCHIFLSGIEGVINIISSFGAGLITGNWEPLKEFFSNLWSWIKNGFKDLLSFFKDIVMKITGFLPDFIKRKLGIEIEQPEMSEIPDLESKTIEIKKKIKEEKEKVSESEAGKQVYWGRESKGREESLAKIVKLEKQLTETKGKPGIAGEAGKPEVAGEGVKGLIKSTGTKATGESTAKALETAKLESQTNINIKLQAEPGTTATVEKVKKKKGDAVVNVASEAYVGAF